VEHVNVALASLTQRKLLLPLNGKHLALAVPGEMPIPFEPDELPGGWVDHFDTRKYSSLGEAWRVLIANNPPLATDVEDRPATPAEAVTEIEA
jgi:hypothetical protein